MRTLLPARTVVGRILTNLIPNNPASTDAEEDFYGHWEWKLTSSVFSFVSISNRIYLSSTWLLNDQKKWYRWTHGVIFYHQVPLIVPVIVVSYMSTSASQLLTECQTDIQASELPRRILSPANELVNVTRGSCDRCPCWIDVLCKEGHWPTEKRWWSSRLETCTFHPQDSVNTAMRTGLYQWAVTWYIREKHCKMWKYIYILNLIFGLDYVYDSNNLLLFCFLLDTKCKVSLREKFWAVLGFLIDVKLNERFELLSSLSNHEQCMDISAFCLSHAQWKRLGWICI